MLQFVEPFNFEMFREDEKRVCFDVGVVAYFVGDDVVGVMPAFPPERAVASNETTMYPSHEVAKPRRLGVVRGSPLVVTIIVADPASKMK